MDNTKPVTKYARYKFLALIMKIKQKSVRQEFYRKWLKIDKIEDIREYLNLNK